MKSVHNMFLCYLGILRMLLLTAVLYDRTLTTNHSIPVKKITSGCIIASCRKCHVMNFHEVGTQATVEKKGCGNQDNCQTKLQCNLPRNTSKLLIFKVITTRAKNLRYLEQHPGLRSTLVIHNLEFDLVFYNFLKNQKLNYV